MKKDIHTHTHVYSLCTSHVSFRLIVAHCELVYGTLEMTFIIMF